MRRAARRAWIAAPLVLALAWCGVLCARVAMAAAEAAGADTGSLDRALRHTLRDPSLHERLGASMARTAASESQARDALAHLSLALELRPASPYAWAALAEARYRLGLADETFQSALIRASALGPHEPAVQESVVLYGLGYWEQLQDEARSAVERMVVAGMKRDPATMLRLAQRRGRLAVACRHLDAAAAPESSRMLCREST